MSRHATKACFPRDHQTPGENALYNKMYGASKKSGVYYSDDRRDAKFHSQKSGGESGKKVSKNTIAAWRHGLEKKGWIERIDGGQRHRNPLTGMWASIEYRVLTHAEWVENYPSRCNRHAAAQTRSQEVPRSDGDKGCDRTQSQGPEPDPIIGSGPDPINPQYRTQPLGHKEKLKEKRERAEKSENSPHTSFDLDGQETALTPADLADLVIKTAIETNAKASASFTANDRAKIERTIKDTFTSDRKKKGLSPAADDIVFSVRQIVKEMDDFALKTAGSRIAASLPGHLAARSEAVAAERKAREVRYAANLEKIEVSEKRCADWKKRFDELIQPPSIEDRGGSVWERGSDIWVEEVHDWLRLNPQPTRFVESNGGLQHIVDNTANDSIAQAVQEYADQCSQFRASEKAEQSKEEETEIPF